eukprot:TRINITY_DN2099_c0_g1_i2.p1 TRINITY_DN2099_c0_g1~~TRINITY_DN2099_c0_g1_i2.p1  ORF type:complete len:211 (+),score=29.41 TRINITY_DN2099_c0_g1_i2:231-863(+)
MQKGFWSSSPMAATAALLLFTILQLAAHGHAQSPPRGTVKIAYFSYSGNGCPSSSAVGSISNDATALTLIFSSFTASTDRGLADTRKNCIVTIKLNYPPGYIYTLGTVTVRGYANLESKVKGTVRIGYHISGRVGSGSATYTFYGPFNNNFERSSGFENAVGSECGRVRDLNINSEVRVHPGKPPRKGIVTMDSQDLKFTQIYNIKWKRC